MMTCDKSRCLTTFEPKMMISKPFHRQSKVYLCFCALEAREGIISVVVRWQMLKITWCIIQLLEPNMSKMNKFMEWILTSQLKYIFLVRWWPLGRLVCFLTNCMVLFRSFKSRILNMLSILYQDVIIFRITYSQELIESWSQHMLNIDAF